MKSEDDIQQQEGNINEKIKSIIQQSQSDDALKQENNKFIQILHILLKQTPLLLVVIGLQIICTILGVLYFGQNAIREFLYEILPLIKLLSLFIFYLLIFVCFTLFRRKELYIQLKDDINKILIPKQLSNSQKYKELYKQQDKSGKLVMMIQIMQKTIKQEFKIIYNIVYCIIQSEKVNFKKDIFKYGILLSILLILQSYKLISIIFSIQGFLIYFTIFSSLKILFKIPTTEEYQTILTALNAPPFNKKYTLISLSQAFENENEAFKILKEVCIQYPASPLQQEEQTTDLTSCSDEDASIYITQKYAILAFDNENATFDEEAVARNLLQPNSSYLSKIILKLLDDPIQAQRIVYTHHFIQNYVKGQFTIDSQLLKQRLENIAEFNKIYQQLELVREKQTEKMLFSEKQQAAQLAAQNDKLNDKNKNIQIQLQQHPEQAQDFLVLSSRLREAKAEIEILKEQIAKSTEQKLFYIKQSEQLQQLSQGTPASILEQTRTDNQKYRNILQELPNEIQEKQALKKLIIGDISEEQVLKFEDDLTNIKSKLRQLQESSGIGSDNDQNTLNSNSANTLTTLRQSLSRFQQKEQKLRDKLNHLKAQNIMLDNKIQESTSEVNLENIDKLEQIPKLQHLNFVAKQHFIKAQGLQVKKERNQLTKQISIGKRTVELLQQQVNLQGNVIGMSQGEQNQQQELELLGQLQQQAKQRRSENLFKINEYHNKKQQLAEISQNLEQVKNQLQNDSLTQNQTIFKLRVNVEKQKADNEQLQTDILNLGVQIQELQVRKAVYANEEFLNNLIKKSEDIKDIQKKSMPQFNQRKNQVKNSAQQKKMFEDMIKILEAKRQSIQQYKSENTVTTDNGGQHIKLE